jgi:type II secretory pathway predicted ATPase ExeA
MYTNHFSLKSLPFENVPDPAYFFGQGEYSRVFSRMIDSLRAGRGLMVVAGPIGTGKTTLCQKLMVSVPEKTRIIWLGEPPDTSEDLLLFLTQEFHINSGASGRIFVLRDIKEHLLKLHNGGKSCLLIMDEVHKISDDVLECVRLLNNLEQGGIKLIQMLLLGQEEFLDKLYRPELESFKQRIAWLETIGKMTPVQTHEYIIHRLNVAGAQSRIFTDDAMEAVIVATRGTPRLVNSFCDRALHVSYEANKTIVDLDSVRRAADDIGLGTEVFLWLTNREKKAAKIAEMEASPVEDKHSPATFVPKTAESARTYSKKRSVDKQRNISPWSVFALVDKLFDKTLGRFSDYPIAQLTVSVLLCAASVYFFIINTM